MGVNRTKNNNAYGLTNAIQALTALPIISNRNPGVTDHAELGTLWINKGANSYFIATSTTAGATHWEAQAVGSGSFATFDVTGAVGTTFTVAADSALTGDLAVGGDVAITGDLDVIGDATFNGDLDITSTQALSMTSTSNTDPAIYLHADGGVLETIRIHSDQGTSDTSIRVYSDVGGILVESIGRATTNAINLVSDAGGIRLDAALNSVLTVTGAGEDIDINAIGGSIHVTASEASATAINLVASDAAGHVAITGTGGLNLTTINTALTLDTGIGEIQVGTDAFAKIITLGNNTGATQVIVNAGTGGAGRIDIGQTANAVPITIGNVTGTTAVVVNTGTGGFGVATTGTGDIILNSDDTVLIDADGVLELNSSAGIIGIGNDADALGINIGTGAAARPIVIGNNTGATSLVINAGTAGAGSINIGQTANAVPIVIGNVTGATGITLNSGTNGIAMASTGAGDITLNSGDTLLIDAAGSIEINSSGGQILIGSDAVAQTIAIGQGAAQRDIFVGNVTGTTSIALNSGTGGIALNTTGAGDVTVTSTDTVIVDAVGVLELNSSGAAIGIGSDADAFGINIGTGAAQRDIIVGNGTGTTSVVINGGTGVMQFGANATAHDTTIGTMIGASMTRIQSGTGDLIIDSADAVIIGAAGVTTIDTVGILELNSSGAAIGIGNDANAFAMNIGTGAAQRVITIGNASAASGVAINCGTAGVAVGTSANAHTTTVGSTTAGSALNLQTPAATYVVASQGVSITAAGQGVSLPGGILVLAGAGDPNGAITAPIGSLWLRSDPAGTTSRLYINTNAGTVWTYFTSNA